MPDTPRNPKPVRLAAIAAALLLLTAACAINEAPPNVPVQRRGQFVTEVPDALYDAGRAPSVAIGEEGNTVVAYLLLQPELEEGEIPPAIVPGDPQPPAVLIATSTKGIWGRTSVTGQETAPKAQGTAEGLSTKEGLAGPPVEIGLALDEQGKHHVAWSSDAGVFYATDEGGAFAEAEKVAPGATTGAALALGTGGSPLISFRDGPVVKVASRDGGKWRVEEVAAGAGEAEGPATATAVGGGADGEVLVAYGTDGRTVVARGREGSWTPDRIPGPGGIGLSMAVDGDGNPHLAYYDTGGTVRHAHSIGGGPWEVSELGSAETGGQESWGSGIDLDDEGAHHVAWASGGERPVRYATNKGGAFSTVELPNSAGGAQAALAVSGDGKTIAAAWYDPENGDLVVARPAQGGLTYAFSPEPPGEGPGGGQPTQPPAAECDPSGTSIEVTAENLAFDEDCLAAPAGEAFTIEFNNQDPAPHNVAIYTDSSAGDVLFQGETFPGPATQTYRVDALDKGTYYFQCDVHPNMNGAFVAG